MSKYYVILRNCRGGSCGGRGEENDTASLVGIPDASYGSRSAPFNMLLIVHCITLSSHVWMCSRLDTVKVVLYQRVLPSVFLHSILGLNVGEKCHSYAFLIGQKVCHFTTSQNMEKHSKQSHNKK